MLAPRDTATRERESLDGLRRFSLDSAGVGRHEGWPQGLPAGAREIPVPASFNDVFAEAEVHDHGGDAWYETLVRAPAGWAGERIVLRFGSATHRAVVWVNGAQLAEHEGGYTPFEADDTEHVKPGAVNRVTVLVNNVLSWQPIPWPGYVEQTHLAGSARHSQLPSRSGRGRRARGPGLRRLRQLLGGDAGRRQQGGRLHPRPPAQGRRRAPAAVLARAAMSP